MNVVMTGGGRLIDVQATAEREPFEQSSARRARDARARRDRGDRRGPAPRGRRCLSYRSGSSPSGCWSRRRSPARSGSSGSSASGPPACGRTCSSGSARRSSRSSPPTAGRTSRSPPGPGSSSIPTRIAAQIVTGIGFLGAGAIIRQGLSIRGLTTAAGLWVVAAIGMAAGRRLLRRGADRDGDRARRARPGALARGRAGHPRPAPPGPPARGRADARGLGRLRPRRAARPPRSASRASRSRTRRTSVAACASSSTCRSGMRARRSSRSSPGCPASAPCASPDEARPRLRERPQGARARRRAARLGGRPLGGTRAAARDGHDVPRERARARPSSGASMPTRCRGSPARTRDSRSRRLGGVAGGLLRALRRRGRHGRRERREAPARTCRRRGRDTARALRRDARRPRAGGRRGRGRGRARGPRSRPSRRGTGGFGYDPVFVPEGESRTVAELGDAWKAEHSHRARAAHALAARLGAQRGNGVDSARCSSRRHEGRVLRKAPLFADLSKYELEHLAKATEDLEVEAGRVLCREGEMAQEFFVIIEGEAEATQDGKQLQHACVTATSSARSR